MQVTCVLVGIGLSCAVALPRIPVSGGIMVAPLEMKQHQGQGCKFQILFEEGYAECVPIASPAPHPPGPSKLCSSPSKHERKISGSPGKLTRNFENSSPPATSQRQSLVENPSFASDLTSQASRGKSHRSGQDRRAAPVVQMGFPKGKLAAF